MSGSQGRGGGDLGVGGERGSQELGREHGRGKEAWDGKRKGGDKGE